MTVGELSQRITIAELSVWPIYFEAERLLEEKRIREIKGMPT